MASPEWKAMTVNEYEDQLYDALSAYEGMGKNIMEIDPRLLIKVRETQTLLEALEKERREASHDGEILTTFTLPKRLCRNSRV